MDIGNFQVRANLFRRYFVRGFKLLGLLEGDHYGNFTQRDYPLWVIFLAIHPHFSLLFTFQTDHLPALSEALVVVGLFVRATDWWVVDRAPVTRTVGGAGTALVALHRNSAENRKSDKLSLILNCRHESLFSERFVLILRGGTALSH